MYLGRRYNHQVKRVIFIVLLILLVSVFSDFRYQSVQASSLTIVPVADAYVDANKSTTNYGTSTILRTDASPIQNSYLRFNIQNLNGAVVTRAVFRLYTNGSSSIGYDVYRVADTTWGEKTVTYANAPVIGERIGSSGTHGTGVWTSVDVSSVVAGEGSYSFAIKTTNTDARSYPSREAGANAPQLVIETTTTPTTTPISTSTITATQSPTSSPSATTLPTVSPSQTVEPTIVATPTDVATSTPELTLTPTPEPTLTQTATSSPTNTTTPTSEASFTPTNTTTPTSEPTNTSTPSSTPVMDATATTTATSTATAAATPTSTATATPTASFTPTPTMPTNNDLSDGVLLTGSSKTAADVGFEKVSLFYGIKLATVNVATTTLTPSLLKDEAGANYSMIFIDAATLNTQLTVDELVLLESAVDTGASHLFVSTLRTNSSAAVSELTDGEILGSSDVADTKKDYRITTSAPDVSRELSGHTVSHTADALDYQLTLGANTSHTQVVVYGIDDTSREYPLFVQYRQGAGSVFVSSNFTEQYLRTNLLHENYQVKRSGGQFIQQWFSHIMPLMMFVRYAGGEEAWHNDRDFANFTLDDPPLRQANFDYLGILPETINNNFHFTLALPPGSAKNPEQSVINAFRDNPDRMSITQHGNNHDGYEFYKYTTTASDPYPARPLADQDADILEGRARLLTFSQTYGIPTSPVMVFPYNISPKDTLTLLKRYNFQSTINSSEVPLEEVRTRTWDAYMHMAEMDHSNFSVILRHKPGSAPHPFDLFIDRPVLMYEHTNFFSNNIKAFNPYAAAVNANQGEVEWRDLGYIMQHVYREKQNDDLSRDILFFGNNVIVSNTSQSERVYHIRREETQNVPIQSVTVDGVDVSYSVSGGYLEVNVVIPAGNSREVRITYGP